MERPFPSANSVVIAGSKPVLVDTGYGSDLRRTESLLVERGIDPAGLSLVVNTHYHSDHVGGNAGLQTSSPTRICSGLRGRGIGRR